MKNSPKLSMILLTYPSELYDKSVRVEWLSDDEEDKRINVGKYELVYKGKTYKKRRCKGIY